MFFLAGHASPESGQCTYRSLDGSLSAYQLMQKNDDDVYEKKKEAIHWRKNRWKIGGS